VDDATQVAVSGRFREYLRPLGTRGRVTTRAGPPDVTTRPGRRRYEPGATPEGAGVFLRFALPAGDLAGALERLAAGAEAYERRRRRALALVPFLLAAAAAALLADLVAADGARVYAWFAPVLAAAVPLVAWATVPEPGRLRAALEPLRGSLVGLLVMIAFPAAFVGLVVAVEGGTWPQWLGDTGVILLTTLLPLVLLALATRRRELRTLGARLARVWRAPPAWRAPLATLIPLAEGLARLAAPGARVTGGVDLTGVERACKELRLPPRPDLPLRRLHRDEWARVELTLRSGARLRLRATEMRSRRVTSSPLPGDDERHSLHTVVVCLWPAATPERDAPAPSRAQPTGRMLRLEHGARRRLVELRLDARTLDLGALSGALERLEPGLRLGGPEPAAPQRRLNPARAPQ
jgi:hypothetical protein